MLSFYQKLDVPHSVSKRWCHSLSVIIMSPHCVWMITVGGADDTKGYVKSPNIFMLTELGRYIFFTEFSVYMCAVSAREIYCFCMIIFITAQLIIN